MVNAYITNYEPTKAISIVDVDSNIVTGTITLPANAEPQGTAMSSDGSRLYVADNYNRSVIVIDTGNNAVIATIHLVTGSTPHAPINLAVSQDNSLLYTTNSDGTVCAVDVLNYTLVTTITIVTDPTQFFLGGIAITPDKQHVWVANGFYVTDSTVYVISTASNTIVNTVTVGQYAYGVAITPLGDYAYVSNYLSGTVSVINTISLSTHSITVGANPCAIVFNSSGSMAYVANTNKTASGTIAFINTGSGAVTTTIDLPNPNYNTCGMAITSDNNYLYAMNTNSATVSVIDIATSSYLMDISIPDGAGGQNLGTFIQPESIPMTTNYAAPQGRLTLTSSTPVMAADVTAATNIYYTPFEGNIVPIYDGTNMDSYSFTQLTMVLNATNQLAGNLYDLFLILSGGVVRIGAGPAWSSTTSRGTGAESTQLTQIDGLWVNNYPIGLTNGTTSYDGIPIGEATYIGTFYCPANGQTQFNIKPTPALGGTNNIIGIWNAYNRVRINTINRDSTGTYTYASTTWREMNGSASNRSYIVDGLMQTSVTARLRTLCTTPTTGAQVRIGVSLNSATAGPNIVGLAGAPANTLTDVTSEESFPPALGLNYYQAMEGSFNAGVTATFDANSYQALLLDTDY